MALKESARPLSTSQIGALIVVALALATLLTLSDTLVITQVLLFSVTGLAFILIIFLRPVWGLYVLIVLLFSLHYLTDSLQILPKLFNFVPDILIVIIFLRAVYSRLRLHKTLPRTPIDIPLSLFVAVAILSSTLNHSDSLLVFFNGLFRQNLKFMLLFYAIVYLALPDRILRRLIILLISLTLLQIPVTIIQKLTNSNWDFAGGTLGSGTTGILALLVLMMMALLFGFSRATRKIRYTVLGLTLFIPAIVGEGKILFVFAPLLIMFLLTYRWAILKTRAVVLLMSFAVVYVVSLLALNTILPAAKSLEVLTNLSYTLQQYERPLSLTNGLPQSRIGDIQYTLQLIGTDPAKTLLGYGPGSSSYAFADIANGSLYRQLADLGTPAAYFSHTQLSMTLLEYGLIGLLVYLFMVWKIYRCNSHFLNSTQDKFWRAFAWGFRGVIFIYVLSILYWRLWSTEILASLFWILAGIVVVQNRNLQSQV